MLHLFKSAVARAVTYGLIGVIVVGLTIGAIRLALPFADLFRSQLEDLLGETLGLEVRVGRLGLRLAGMAPQLTVLDAELLDRKSGRTQLSLKQLRVNFSLVASMRELAPHIESVTLVGAHLVIKRLKDGGIVVSGLEGMEAGDPEAMTFFLGNGRFLLTESDVFWVDEKAAAKEPRLHLSDVQTYFENTDERHKIGIRARLFGDPEAHLRLAGDLRGTPRTPADWSGEIYLRWQDRNLEQTLRGRLPAGLALESTTAEIESWNDITSGTLRQSLTRVSVRGLTAGNDSSTGDGAPLHLDLLEGLLRWRKVATGWHLDIRDLTLARNGTERPPSDLGIRFATGEDGEWTLEGGNQFLDLEDARDLLAQLPELLPEAGGALQNLRPRGRLHDLRFRFAHLPALPPKWALSGRVEELELEAHDRIPGMAGLDAEVAGNERDGRMDLTSGNLALDLPRLFPDPIRLDALEGAIHWERGDAGALKISSPLLVAGNSDIDTRSRFQISLPADGIGPILDLQTNFSNVDFTSVRRYVPSKRLKQKLANWLGMAFERGRVPSGTLLFRGTPADFPFHEGEGRFQVLISVEDGALKYHKDWPALEDITGEVHFLNRGMEILVSQARFLSSEVTSGYAAIPNLKRAVGVQILGRTEGPFSDGIRVLGETPLRRKLGGIAGAFEADGVARLDLNMTVPLTYKGYKGPLQLDGELTWPGPASLAIRKLDIELTDLDGRLLFTERTLNAETIEARLWDVPVRLSIDTLQGGEDGTTTTRIRADGRLPAELLAKRFPFPGSEDVSGRSLWELRLDAPRAESGENIPAMQYELESNLAGVAIDLPPPLGKGATQTRRLHFSGRLAPGEAFEARGGYGDLGINLGFARGDNGELRLSRGTLSPGGDAGRLPDGEGLVVSGSIGSLDLPSWLNWWSNRKPSARGEPGAGNLLRSADLRVRRLILTDIALTDLRFDLDRRGNQWEAGLTARELDGRISVPHRVRREPIRIELARLDLKGLLAHGGKNGQALADRKRSDPRHAHTLDLSVEQLLWGENPLGHVDLRTQATADGLDFTEMTLKGASMSITGSGSWKQQGGEQRTSLSLNATGSDLGEFLRSLEFTSLFYKAPAELDLSLQWPGGPSQFSPAEIRGNVEIEVGAGSLLEVEPGVGRMLGILNLEALQRRLSLDFSDLFDRGFAFERISGDLSIGGGKAEIKSLDIKGPSASVSIVGQTDLVKQELDQIVTVTPRIGTGVAIASAVAGGPLVGAAVFLADRVSGGAVDRLGQHQYVVSGPWAEPEIQRGTLGASEERDGEDGPFLAEPGRAGAEKSQERKTQKARAEPGTGTEASKAKPSLFRRSDGENLFLDGN